MTAADHLAAAVADYTDPYGYGELSTSQALVAIESAVAEAVAERNAYYSHLMRAIRRSHHPAADAPATIVHD